MPRSAGAMGVEAAGTGTASVDEEAAAEEVTGGVLHFGQETSFTSCHAPLVQRSATPPWQGS